MCRYVDGTPTRKRTGTGNKRRQHLDPNRRRTDHAANAEATDDYDEIDDMNERAGISMIKIRRWWLKMCRKRREIHC
jgi:hypothetical protein